MVKPMRNLASGSAETSFVKTTTTDVTPVVDVPKETTPSPTAQTPTEGPLSNVAAGSSGQKAVFSDIPTKPVVSSSDTHVEHSGMTSEGHNGYENELVVLKTEKTVSRMLDADAKEGVEIKAKKPPIRVPKPKSAQAVMAPSVEEKFHVHRAQFQELQQRIIALQGHVLLLQTEIDTLKDSQK
ncbi:hypothetical protein M9H77_20527 [Catharanthus roseus]|uniref:Uncharacterized protein n=1 Tax=Catharanthus roseus TaxID=4058 RepID=A0ACC0AKT9_CATRO|nr:hypothetical protein M9H77_20527 [Catharanthus roseus]